jgi:hypothetical protein
MLCGFTLLAEGSGGGEARGASRYDSPGQSAQRVALGNSHLKQRTPTGFNMSGTPPQPLLADPAAHTPKLRGITKAQIHGQPRVNSHHACSM